MKVVYVIDSLRPGGKERQSVALLKGLVAQGHTVEVVTMGEERFFAPELEQHNIRIHYVLRQSKADLRPWFTMSRILRDFRPDVVHTTCWMTSFFSLPACRRHSVPLVNGSIRNSFDGGGIKWKIERLLLRLAEARIANSRAGFHSRGFDPEGAGNFVVYNGFDGGRLRNLDVALIDEIHRRAAGRKIVGMVAQFKNDKDYPAFLAAARRILARRDDVVFVTVGDGINLEPLKQTCADYGDRIIFLGRSSRVESIVSCFYLGVLATFTEGISNAIMEYMAAGKAVVATDGGGTAELVVDGVTGRLVPPRDVDALEQAIVDYLNSPERSLACGELGRARINKAFDYESLIHQTTAIYRRVMSLSSN